MAFYAGLTPLCDVLANLFPTGIQARVVVAEAGIPEQLVDFGGPAIEVWQRVLAVAQGNGQVQALVDVARKHYSGNAALADAEQAWQAMPPPALPSRSPAAPGGGNVSISIAGTSVFAAGGDVQGVNVVNTGDVTGDGNEIGGERKAGL